MEKSSGGFKELGGKRGSWDTSLKEVIKKN